MDVAASQQECPLWPGACQVAGRLCKPAELLQAGSCLQLIIAFLVQSSTSQLDLRIKLNNKHLCTLVCPESVFVPIYKIVNKACDHQHALQSPASCTCCRGETLTQVCLVQASSSGSPRSRRKKGLRRAHTLPVPCHTRESAALASSFASFPAVRHMLRPRLPALLSACD